MIIKSKKYSGIKISIFSKEQILNISHGKISNSKTLNFRNFKPEIGGLFCDKIFGSSNEKCHCERVSSYDNLSFICRYCGVETSVKDRNLKRKRFGHIKLDDFFMHTLYYKINPYYLSTILNISLIDIKKILYNNYYIVTYSDLNFLEIDQIIKFNEYIFYKKKNYNKFSAETGFNALKYLLNRLDFSTEINNLKKIIGSTFNKNNKKKAFKRYKILKTFYNFNINPLNMFLKNLLVLPADLRPIIRLPNDTVVSSDLNELYKRVVNSNNRHRKINKIYRIPSNIILKENKILQNHIDNLFVGNHEKNKFKSLSENLEGKLGFFRKNLLGKRVDYSGRAVITSGPNMEFGECGLPIIIAMEIFRPFIYNKILLDNSFNIKMAKREVDKITKLSKSILLDLFRDFYIILNRAPTLHRLGIQAFKPILTDDNVIKVHPLVCAAYNADFDGDQMAVHMPISIKSKLEIKKLLNCKNNILYPSNGTCCITPSKDIILGIYYYTKFKFLKVKIKFFNSINDMILAYNYNFIKINTVSFLRFKIFDNKKLKINYKIYKTNLSRSLIFDIFSINFSYNLFNKILNKNSISKILNLLIHNYDFNSISLISNNLMKLGFNLITRSGFSISISDMFFSYQKRNILSKLKNVLISYNLDYLNFILTKNSKKKKIIDLWEHSCDIISNFILQDLSFSYYLDNKGLFIKSESFNFLYMMLDSGSRCSESQVKQICSSRGLIGYKKQSILEIPVLSSLREGLNVFEYFYFSHNSRKTLADTALKTSSAGYLTRRLVEISNNIFISEYDCKTLEGINIKSLIYQGILIENFFDRILGRTILKDFLFKKNNFLLKKNSLIDLNLLYKIKKLNINTLVVRSPLKCKSKYGVCCLCYGSDLGKNEMVSIGEMVGIVAAQSIGEPGTQLTMRTFHTGGFISKAKKNSFFKSNYSGFLNYSYNLKYVTNKYNLKIVVSLFSNIEIYFDSKKENLLESFNLPYASYLLFDNNEEINKGEIICKWDSDYSLVISEFSGNIKYKNLKDDNCLKRKDLNIYEIKNSKILPSIQILNNCVELFNYKLNVGDLLMFEEGDFVNIGDVLIKHPLDFSIAEDIIGGLPRIDNFFEARYPRNSALISPVSGFIKFSFLKKKKCINVYIKNKMIFSSFIGENKKIIVNENDYVNRGDILVEGEINIHDILFIYGKEYLINYLIKEIKYIYFSQGIFINDKHLEIVINQMLKFVVVTNSNNSNFVIGEVIRLENILKNRGKFKKINYDIILLGITNSSLKNKSFLSAASFQRTSYVLSEAALKSKYDDMSALKNIIMSGDVFNAGSGSYNKILNI
ncbi:DNA-directed RNA polymerase beta subunit [Candidatus Nasuia deltocephalinicola]|uniref:DNA-directed RNA polymerase subunit n=1 Tax=Candidatus Nasuia deltocephalincola TaxID=1160784 RepID=A0A7G6UHI7_9PROT|nr:DNA-directed RNA polymerase beta subunit [Candidatus Nasuia deltocephalinicola]